MKRYLVAFRTLLASLSRRISRVEDIQIAQSREINRKLDQILIGLSSEKMLALDRLPAVIEQVNNHDERIRKIENLRPIGH